MSTTSCCAFHQMNQGSFIHFSDTPKLYDGTFNFGERSIEIHAPAIVVASGTSIFAEHLSLYCDTLFLLGVIQAPRITIKGASLYKAGIIRTIERKPTITFSHYMCAIPEKVQAAYDKFLAHHLDQPIVVTGIDCSSEKPQKRERSLPTSCGVESVIKKSRHF